MSLKEALEYAAYGWAVFPLLPKSKEPATKHGFHDASKDPKTIKGMWGVRTNLNVGLATGSTSGFWVLDVDKDKGGEETLSELENANSSLPETLVSRTGGGGKHYLFKLPDGIKVPSTIGKLGKGLDTRGEGGYIAAPPSIHPNGTLYEWEGGEISEAPQWLLKSIMELKKGVPKTGTVDAVEADWTTEDILSMLESIDPDERDTWIQVGMALHAGGWPVSMWDTWSMGSTKYKNGEPNRIWKGFKNDGGVSIGSLVYMAQQNGWQPKEKPHEELDLSNVGGVDLRAFKAKYEVPEIPVMDTKIHIGGLVGDTLSWINSTAFKLQPELSIMNTLAALGAVFGRRYALQKLNTRTNIYMVGIAETGQGKDNSRQKIKRLLRLAELEMFCGPDEVRSAPGLMVELKNRPSLLINIDEIGMFMKALFDPKAPTYLREISTMFTKMYSCSGTSYEGGIIASQPKERTVLNEPNLCIYGTTTPSSYAEAMRSSSIKSGELNRFIVLKSSVDFPEPNFSSDNCDPPESLISRWKAFKAEGLAAAPDIVEQEKTIVMLGKMENEVNNLFRYQDKMISQYRNSGLGALWVRYRENVLKIAMIIAIARDFKKPVLIESDLEFGKAIVGSSICFMMKFATETMYDGEFQKKCSEFMESLKEGATSRSEMLRKMRIKTKELDEIERSLKEQGKIDFDEKLRPRIYEVL
jgi:hypothetical protein